MGRRIRAIGKLCVFSPVSQPPGKRRTPAQNIAAVQGRAARQYRRKPQSRWKSAQSIPIPRAVNVAERTESEKTIPSDQSTESQERNGLYEPSQMLPAGARAEPLVGADMLGPDPGGAGDSGRAGPDR